jgi:hypothetical protein
MVRLGQQCEGAGADSATAQKKYLHSATVQVFFCGGSPKTD